MNSQEAFFARLFFEIIAIVYSYYIVVISSPNKFRDMKMYVEEKDYRHLAWEIILTIAELGLVIFTWMLALGILSL